MPAYVPSSRESSREQDILNDGHYQQARPELLSLVKLLQGASGADDFWELEHQLIVNVKARQQLIGEGRSELTHLRSRRGELARQVPKPEPELIDLQQQITRKEHEIGVQDALRHVLLGIGDGLAWKRLGFDRAAISVLGQGQRVAWLSDGRGWEAEIAALEQHRRDGHFVLLNDLTTCMRHGDLTVFEGDRHTVYEVKAGTTVSDGSPQMQRLRQAVDFINTGFAEIDGEPGWITRSPSRYRTHLGQLPALFRRARETGSASAMVSECQFVVAHDLRFFGGPAGMPKLASPQEARAATGWPDSDVVLDSGTTIRRMRDRHHSFATLAPLSIYPLPPEQLCDLIHGWLNFTTLLNVSRLAQSLGRDGIRAEAVAPPESQELFLRVLVPTGRDRAVEGTVAPHEREMMLLELMTSATLRAGIQALVADTSAEATAVQRRMVFRADEAATWGRQVF